MLRYLLILVSLTAFGQSLRLSNGKSGTWSQPDRADNLPVRIELWIHDVSAVGGTGTFINGGGVSFSITWASGGQWWLTSPQRTIGTPCTINPQQFSGGFWIRYQYDPSQGSFGKETCEWGTVDGSDRRLSTQFYTGTLTDNDVTGNMDGLDANRELSVGFYRAYTTLVAESSKPPAPCDVGDLVDFTFNNVITDRSGNGRDMTMTSPVYVSSPSHGVFPSGRVYQADPWLSFGPIRAGYPAQLDAANSYTYNESSCNLTYFWQQVSGPSTVKWSSRTAAQPTITGTLFGPYRFRLVATDAGSVAGTADFDVGSVSTDANGVVIQADADADTLFGPMIAMGRNPWRYMDKKNVDALTARSAVYDSTLLTGTYQGQPAPPWVAWKTGTVTYKRVNNTTTTLNGAINSTDTTIVVNSTEALDLTGLPGTPIILQASTYYSGENIRICSVSGTTLTVCFDGRGAFNSTAASHGTGATFYQLRVKGTTTAFLTEVCPGGAGGLPGTVRYNTGTASVNAASTALTGSGTNWTSDLLSRPIQISGTYSSGTPFKFVAAVSAVNSTTSITLSRAYPSGADNASGVSYAVLNNNRFVGLEWTHPNIATGGASALDSASLGLTVIGCESDTYLNVTGWAEPWYGGEETGRKYNVWESTWLSDFGPSYYDEALAWYSTYFRSGYQGALDAARKLSRWWLMMPEGGGGYYGYASSPRRASVTGAVAGLVLDPAVQPSAAWGALRTAANITPAGFGCNSDIREIAYTLSWLTLAANFDPDSGAMATHQSKLADAYTRDNGCKGANNAHPNVYRFDGETTGLTLTNGSAAVTGTGIPSSLCPVDASGTASFTNGSTAVSRVSGSSFVTGKMLAVLGARTNGPWHTTYVYVNGNSITLSEPWAGSTATYSFQLKPIDTNNWYVRVIRDTAAPDIFADSNMDQTYSCTWNSSTSITLDRNWHGSSISTGAMSMLNLLGKGTQPFLLGIKTWQMDLGLKGGQSGYSTLRDNAAAWIFNTGRYPTTKGLYYGRDFPHCEPAWDGDQECGYYPSSAYSTSESRIAAGETNVAFQAHYEANPTVGNKTILDEIYGGTWGRADYNTGGVYYDSNNAIDTSGIDFGSYKWSGFMYGLGQAHRWPAVRLGGVAAPVNRTLQIGANIASIPNATKYRVTATLPSGAVVTNTCTTSPCGLTVDGRQNRHLVRVEYLSAGNAVLAAGEQQIQEVY